VDGAINAVRLSSVLLVERTVFNGRITVRWPPTDASAEQSRAEKLQGI
jgi:hypothetical protein